MWIAWGDDRKVAKYWLTAANAAVAEDTVSTRTEKSAGFLEGKDWDSNRL